MNKSDKKALIAAICVASGGSALFGWFWAGNRGEERERAVLSEASSGPGCGQLATARQVYSFEQASLVRLDPTALLPQEGRSPERMGGPGAGGEVVARDTRGAFLWRGMEVDEEGAVTVAARFEVFEVGEGQEIPARLKGVGETPVLVRLDGRCQLEGIAAPEGTAEEVIRQWELLLSLFEFVAAPQELAMSWRATQRDGVGSYLAAYEEAAGEGEVQRVRREYLEVEGPGDGELRARVVESKSRAQWGEEGKWLKWAQGVEAVEVTTEEGRLFAQVRTEFGLERRDGVPERGFWTEEIDEEEYRWRAFGERRWGEARGYRPKPEPGLSAKSTGEVLRLFEERLEGAGQIRGGLDLMIAYLRLSPEHAGEVFERLLAGEIAAEHRSVLFLALREAGGLASREVLIAATEHGALAREDRLRALAALSKVRAPDEAVVEAVEQVWERGDAGDVEARSAMLAMGSLAGNEGLSEELRWRVEAQLRAGLGEGAGASERRLAMEAIGNAGASGEVDEELVAEVSGLVEDSDPGVRATAQETLRRLGVEAPYEELLVGLMEEEHAGVKGQIRRRLLESEGTASPTAIDQASRMLAANPPVGVRRTLIEFLGGYADEDPLARYALIEHFPRESSRELVVLIGQYVSASELSMR